MTTLWWQYSFHVAPQENVCVGGVVVPYTSRYMWPGLRGTVLAVIPNISHSVSAVLVAWTEIGRDLGDERCREMLESEDQEIRQNLRSQGLEELAQ